MLLHCYGEYMRKIILDRDQKEKIITLFKNGTNITLIQKICNEL
jgi:hypothetical protein